MSKLTDEQAERMADEIISQSRPKFWALLKFAWYSFLLFVGTASVSGAIWAVVSLLRWL